MGGEFGTHRRDEKCVQNFGRYTLSEESSEDLGAYISVVLE